MGVYIKGMKMPKCGNLRQRRTDQDYTPDDWKIDTFIHIFNKWQIKPFTEVNQFLFGDVYDIDDLNDDEEYYRRSAAYKEIARPIENLLYDDTSTSYIQLFRGMDSTFALQSYKGKAISLIFKSSDDLEDSGSEEVG